MKKKFILLFIISISNIHSLLAQSNINKTVISLSFYNNDTINKVKSGTLSIYSKDTLIIEEVILYEGTGTNRKKIIAINKPSPSKEYTLAFEYSNSKSKIIKKNYILCIIKDNTSYNFTSEQFQDDPAFENYFSAYLTNTEMEIILK